MSKLDEPDNKEELILTQSQEGREEEIQTESDKSSQLDALNIEASTIFKETPYRFAVCIAYCMLSFGNAMQWVTYSSTAHRFEQYFGYTRIQVDLFSLIFMILYPIGCVPEGYLMDNISARLGLSIASITTIVGAGLKVLTNQHKAWAYIGQILCSSFQPTILNSPAKIASVWFRDERRALVTVICCSSNSIGILFGYIFHTFFIAPEATDQDYRDQFFNYVLWTFILEVVICLPIVFMDSKPVIPVSNSQLNYVAPPVLTSLKLLVKNPAFMWMVLCLTCIVGFINIYGTIINPYMAMYEISDEQASYTAAISNGIGIISALVVSVFLDKSKKFKTYLFALNSFGLVCFILLTVLLEVTHKEDHFVILIIVYSLLICSVIPIISNGMDYVCELVYPVGESVAGGLIMCFNQISGIIGVFIANALMQDHSDKKYLTNVMGIILFFISCVSIFMIKEKLSRTQKEEEIPNQAKKPIARTY